MTLVSDVLLFRHGHGITCALARASWTTLKCIRQALSPGPWVVTAGRPQGINLDVRGDFKRT